jgi:hypothetical protein
MTPLDTLAPDQRAVLELVLRQGRSYGELSELLAIPERDVRARADAGLRALAGEPRAGVDSGRIADWLLGQQPDDEAGRTRAAIARSEPAREWATLAAERLIVLGGSVPDIPDAAETTEPAARPRPLRDGSAPRPRPVRAEPATAAAGAAPRSSRLGGAIVLGVVAVVVAGFLVWMFALRDDEETPAASNPPAATATATATPDPAAANDIALIGANGSQAAGFMRLLRSKDGTVRFGLAAEKVPPNGQGDSYAVWFTRTGAKPRRLGFAQNAVGEDGVLTTAGPQKSDEDDFPKWFATYEKVLVTKETTATAKKPGPAILEGTLPAGSG